MPFGPSRAQPVREPHSHIGVRFSHDVQPSLPTPNTMPGDIARAATQTANAGVTLSTILHRSARPDADISEHVTAIAHSLDSLATLLQPQNGSSLVSENAIQDANDIIARSDAIFNEIRQTIGQRDGRHGEENLTALPRFTWPMNEQSTELLRRRLVSVKDSLALLLHILHCAHVQAQGGFAERDYEEARQLHVRQENSLQALKALESRLGSAPVPDGEIFHASHVPSRVPTIDFIINTQGPSRTPPSTRSTFRRESPTATTADHLDEPSPTSDTEDTVTDEDGEEEERRVEPRLTAESLADCTARIQELLKGVGNLQRSSERRGRLCSKFRVEKLYKRFCRRFESSMLDRKTSVSTSAVPFPGFQPPPDSRSDPASHGPPVSAPDFQSNSVHPYESSSRNLAPTQESRRTQSVGTPSQYIDQLSARTSHNDSPSDGRDRDEGAIDPHLRSISKRNPSVSVMAVTHVQNEVMSRETSKEGSQSGGDRDMESTPGHSGPVHYTKTGRISKAKKGLKVHTCSECGKSFTRAEHLRRHQKNHGPDQVTCDLCGKVFFRVDLLMRHVERHKDGPLTSSTTHSLHSSQDVFGAHRPVIYPSAPPPPPPPGLDRRDSRAMERPGAEPSPSWQYAWDERDRRYVYVAKGVPPTGDQRTVLLDTELQIRPSHGEAPFHPHGMRSTAYDEQPHSSAVGPTDYESPWHNPNKRRRTEGDIHRAPHSPLHSPPSPWVKEHRTLPPLPSPLQPSYTHSPPSGTNDHTKGLRSTSPSVGRPWTHVNSPQTASPAVATRPPIPPQPPQYYEEPRPFANAQPPTANETAERGWGPTPAHMRNSQGHSHEPAAYRPSSFSKSQPTSPNTTATPRIYPNPIRPHEPRHGTYPTYVDKAGASQPVDMKDPEPAAVRHDSGITEYTGHIPSRDVPSTQDKEPYQHQRHHETEDASRKRRIDEQSIDQHQHFPTYPRHAQNPRPDNASYASRHDARPSVKDGEADAKKQDKKDIVDKLLERWTVPRAGVAS